MSTVTLRSGEIVVIADIADLDVGRDALAELDRSIIAIEEQIERAEKDGHAGDWLVRAGTALKHRRRARAPLQERISELRRAEKARQLAAAPVPDSSRRKWLTAFWEAVRADLPADHYQRLTRVADEAARASGEGSR